MQNSLYYWLKLVKFVQVERKMQIKFCSGRGFIVWRHKMERVRYCVVFFVWYSMCMMIFCVCFIVINSASLLYECSDWFDSSVIWREVHLSLQRRLLAAFSYCESDLKSAPEFDLFPCFLFLQFFFVFVLFLFLHSELLLN